MVAFRQVVSLAIVMYLNLSAAFLKVLYRHKLLNRTILAYNSKAYSKEAFALWQSLAVMQLY